MLEHIGPYQRKHDHGLETSQTSSYHLVYTSPTRDWHPDEPIFCQCSLKLALGNLFHLTATAVFFYLLPLSQYRPLPHHTPLPPPPLLHIFLHLCLLSSPHLSLSLVYVSWYTDNTMYWCRLVLARPIPI